MLDISTVLPNGIPPLEEIDLAKVAATCERCGFHNYSYEDRYDLTLIRKDELRIQVRDTEHYAPDENVKALATIYSQDPRLVGPIVVTKDGYIVDGNTRDKGAKKAKLTHIPAIILDVAAEGATPSIENKLHILGSVLNQHGKGQTEPEKRRSALRMIDDGWALAAIQRSTGLSQTTVTQIRKEHAVKDRLNTLGITPPQKGLKLTVFGTDAILGLHDEPFRRFYMLVNDAGLKSREVTELIKEVVHADSDKTQLDLIARKRGELGERITEHARTGDGKPSKPAQLRRLFGQVLSFEGKEKECVERSQDEEVCKAYLDKLERTGKVLDKIRKLQGTYNAGL